MSKRQINSTFTKQELKFIFLEFGQNPSPTVVKRKFCQRFAIKGRNRLKYRQNFLFTTVGEGFCPNSKMINFSSCFVKVELICLLLIWIAMKIKNLFYIDNVHEKGSFSQKETIELQKI